MLFDGPMIMIGFMLGFVVVLGIAMCIDRTVSSLKLALSKKRAEKTKAEVDAQTIIESDPDYIAAMKELDEIIPNKETKPGFMGIDYIRAAEEREKGRG